MNIKMNLIKHNLLSTCQLENAIVE